MNDRLIPGINVPTKYGRQTMTDRRFKDGVGRTAVAAILLLFVTYLPLNECPKHPQDSAYMSLKDITRGESRQSRKSPRESPEVECLVRSVDRSRKRYLSPGLLRGDLAVDRLKQQEEGASPNLKKARESPPSPTPGGSPPRTPNVMALSADEFRKAMSGMSTRFDALDTKIVDLSANVRLNSSKIDSHEALIKRGQLDVEHLRKEVENIKNAPCDPDRLNNQPPREPPGFTPVRNEVNEHEFMLARRSLRLWPIIGTTGEELWRETGNFLHVMLGLPDIGEDQIERIARPPSNSSFAAKDEAILTFKLTHVRDAVIGQSGKLASRVDTSGRPTAGIRIEVPNSLRGSFATLYKYGQQLRQRHGPGTRRHIKFNDAERTLFLNVKLPGDLRWSRVEEDFARRGLQVRNRLTSQEMEARFDIGNTAVGFGRARTASTSTVPVPAQNLPQWTGRRPESTST